MSKTGDYYDECTEHKKVKSEIASAYLFPWANIVGQHAKELHYLDLFSGRGEFKDKSPATPLHVFDKIQEASIKIPWLLDILQVSFYEGKKAYYDVLLKSLKSHNVYSRLKHEPLIKPQKIDAKFIAEISGQIKDATYSFIDPYGYSDISLDLIDGVSKNWGCDCLFYLSISGLVRNIQDPEKEESVTQFFGANALKRVKQSIAIKPEQIPLSKIIMSEIKNSLRSGSRKYRVIEYCVEFDNVRRESHYLMFISKHKRGFEIMRDIMLKRGILDNQGYPFLGFSTTMKEDQIQTELPLPSNSQLTFSKRLLADFAKNEIKVEALLENCLEREYPLADAHVRKLLRFLEIEGKVKIMRLDKYGKARKNELIQKHDVIKFLN